MINEKQAELSHKLYKQLKQKFPEIELADICESPISPDSIWVNIIYPEDEDREIEMQELAGKISYDILVKYGYHIIIGSAAKPAKQPA